MEEDQTQEVVDILRCGLPYTPHLEEKLSSGLRDGGPIGGLQQTGMPDGILVERQ